MSGVQTRRQKMETELQPNGNALANGQAKMNGTVEKVHKQVYKQENIFLFIPNIIGRGDPGVQDMNSLLTSNRRLLSCLPRHSLTLLHASTSPNMFRSLQHLLPA